MIWKMNKEAFDKVLISHIPRPFGIISIISRTTRQEVSQGISSTHHPCKVFLQLGLSGFKAALPVKITCVRDQVLQNHLSLSGKFQISKFFIQIKST
jgi:hypothetical protein